MSPLERSHAVGQGQPGQETDCQVDRHRKTGRDQAERQLPAAQLDRARAPGLSARVGAGTRLPIVVPVAGVLVHQVVSDGTLISVCLELPYPLALREG